MSQHPQLDAAIKRGEVKQCAHCGVYWVPTHIAHRCLQMAEADLRTVSAERDEAVRLIKARLSSDTEAIRNEQRDFLAKMEAK